MRTLCISLALALLGNFASASELSDASTSYRRHNDFASLQTIVRHLTKGMSRRSVEKLLGKDAYSPIDGLYYYSSDKREYVAEAERELSVYLVVEYRDDSGKITGQLQSWELGPVGE